MPTKLRIKKFRPIFLALPCGSMVGYLLFHWIFEGGPQRDPVSGYCSTHPSLLQNIAILLAIAVSVLLAYWFYKDDAVAQKGS